MITHSSELEEMRDAAFARSHPDAYNKLWDARGKRLSEQISLRKDIKNFFKTLVLFKNWLKNLF